MFPLVGTRRDSSRSGRLSAVFTVFVYKVSVEIKNKKRGETGVINSTTSEVTWKSFFRDGLEKRSREKKVIDLRRRSRRPESRPSFRQSGAKS